MKKITITGYIYDPREEEPRKIEKSITVRTKLGFMIAIQYLKFFFDYIEIEPLSAVRDILKGR